ncbi:MAG: sensor histidine kinase [Candidatus Methylomirabilaceae bacterium]
MRASVRRPGTVHMLRAFPVLHTGAQLHTLANILSAAGALLRRRPVAAEDLLAQLVAYLRDLMGLRRPLIPLADELRLALTFIGLERVRMGSRIRLEVACTPESLAALVPPLVLHPLVENAVRHGIARRPMGGRVRILGRTAAGTLHLAVSDDGPGMRRTAAAGRAVGWGLTGVRLRLAALWGPAARLRILCGAEAGTMAIISLPLMEAPASTSGRGV